MVKLTSNNQNNFVHERSDTENDEKRFPCRFCDKKFAYKKGSQRHEKSLHGEEYLNAQACKKGL